MTSYEDRLGGLDRNIGKVNAVRDLLKARGSKLNDSVSENRVKSDMYSKCSEIFKSWLEKSVESNITNIADLATTGLRHVITDQSLSFMIERENKLNRVSMKFLIEQNGIQGDPLTSFGGGAAVVISMILRLSVMQKTGCANLLILDESMVALANAYVPDAANFIRRLSEETGIHILMVTHNNEFISNSHLAYEGTKDVSLRLKRVHSMVNV